MWLGGNFYGSVRGSARVFDALGRLVGLVGAGAGRGDTQRGPVSWVDLTDFCGFGGSVGVVRCDAVEGLMDRCSDSFWRIG